MALPLTWGATQAEARRPYAADHLVDGTILSMTRAISVAAPPELTWRWLCQIAVAPYSYDWIDNRGRPQPTHPHPRSRPASCSVSGWRSSSSSSRSTPRTTGRR